MSSLGNKEVMAKNLTRYMELNNIDRNEICDALNFKYTTFSDWINAKTYPRIDKIEIIANFFGISKADLIEDKSTEENYKYRQKHIFSNLQIEFSTKDALTSKSFKKLASYNKCMLSLNNLNQDKVVNYAEGLLNLQDQEYELNAAHSLPNATQEDIDHDEDIMNDNNF